MKKIYRTLSLILSTVICLGVVPFTGLTVSSAEHAEQWLWPVAASKTISSNFGLRDLDGNGSLEDTHAGIDISCSVGTEIRATKSGTVIDHCSRFRYNEKVYSGGMESYGNYVVVAHDDGTKAIYAHLSPQEMITSGHVDQGQKIALSGDSGSSGGPHMHFQVRKNDGQAWSTANGLYNVMPTQNCISENGLYVVNLATYSLPGNYPGTRMDYIFELETGYLSKCIRYPSFCQVRVTNDTTLKTLPCSAATSSDSENVGPAHKGDYFTVTAIYVNDQDNLWYRVYSHDTDGYCFNSDNVYLFAGDTVKVNYFEEGNILRGQSIPGNQIVGKSFPINGTIETSYNKLSSVGALVYSNADGEVKTGKQIAVDTFRYSLNYSEVDNATAFNELPAGSYQFQIIASQYGYFALSGQAMQKYEIKNSILLNTTFTEQNSASVCRHPSCYLLNACDATCTEPGYTGDKVCSECSMIIESGSVIPAAGHTYEDTVRYDTDHPHEYYRKCGNCENRYYLGIYADCEGCPACHPTFLAMFYSDEIGGFFGYPDIYNDGISAEADRYFEIPDWKMNVDGYVFLGWSTSPGGKVEYIAGDSFYLAEDTDFYAVWMPAGAIQCGPSVYAVFNDGTLTISGTGETYNYPYSGSDSPFCNNLFIQHVIIENGVTSVGDCLFEYCHNLASVSIGDSVQRIGARAFHSCSNLGFVIFPKSVKTIDERAFMFCHSLQTVQFTGPVDSIGNLSFCSCENLVQITIADTIEYIGPTAFGDCVRLVEVINNSGMNITAGSADHGGIAAYALYVGTDSRSHFSMIDDYLFYIYDNTNYLVAYEGNGSKAELPDDIDYVINGFAFYGSDIESAVIPESVTTVRCSAFQYCDRLRSVTIPESAVIIDQYAFDNCTSLTDVYYNGTKEGWEKIRIASGNAPLTGAVIHYAKCLSHSWNDGIMTAQASCTENGNIHYVCTVCGAETDKPIQAYGHIYDNACDPTCNRCSYTRTVSHNYIPIVTVPSCTAMGYTTYICSVCQNSYVSDMVSALGHAWSDYSHDDTYHWRTCTREGCAETEKGAHSGGTVTCTDKAVCSVCLSEYGSASGHAYGVWEITAAPAVDSTGLLTRTCAKDGSHKETFTLPKLSTENGYAYHVVTSPGCETTGAGRYSYTKDGQTFTFDVTLSAAGHHKISIPAQESTCSERGWEAYCQCDVCKQLFSADGSTKIDEVPYLPLSENAHIVFTIGDITGRPGNTVEIPISVTGDTEISGLVLYQITYDKNNLEFLGFGSYGELITANAAGESAVGKETITLGYSKDLIPDGTICTASFRIKDTAPDGDYTVSFSIYSASRAGKEVSNTLNAGTLTVSRWLDGDFDNNGVLDMQDAVHFIGWINFSYIPGLYPMIYDGDKDFDHNGVVDMQDAVYFIGWVNFSYIPDLYDIKW